jgi:DNA-binding IclR family transcriptional regulator
MRAIALDIPPCPAKLVPRDKTAFQIIKRRCGEDGLTYSGPEAAHAPPRTLRARSETATLDLALRVLEFLAGQPQPIALTAIARNFGASKATVYRHLQGFARHGFVRRDDSTGRYAIGVKLMVLGESSRSHFEIVAVAREDLMRLREATGQAITICALVDADLVVLDLIHGRTLVEFATRPGTRLDLHASAHGKVWLAFGPPELLRRVAGGPLKAWTPHTLADAEVLQREVALVRERGWATAPDQVIMGINTLAAPVFDHRGSVVGSIAIVGSTQHVAAVPTDGQAADVLATAQRISRALGWKD